jgi:adenylate cyclase
MRVKGKDRPVAVYESLGYRSAERDGALGGMLEAYGRGLAAYRAREWSGAVAAFETALRAEPADGVSKMYLERCRIYAEAPPPVDWDGVWVLKEK